MNINEKYLRLLFMSTGFVLMILLFCIPVFSVNTGPSLHAYVFPNPAVSHTKPTLHVEAASAKTILNTKIFDGAGELVFEINDLNAYQIDTGDNKVVYERPFDSSTLNSGVYYGIVRSQDDGDSKVFRFTVIK